MYIPTLPFPTSLLSGFAVGNLGFMDLWFQRFETRACHHSKDVELLKGRKM
jgi:hypothetical protein